MPLTLFGIRPRASKYQNLTCLNPAVTKYDPSLENDTAFTRLVTLLPANLIPFFQSQT